MSPPADSIETVSYLCDSCGFSSPKWMGFCPRCRSDRELREVAAHDRRIGPAPEPVSLDKLGAEVPTRIDSGVGEVDRILGGGIVPGSVVLVGGEPGIGKSTLLLQMAGALGQGGFKVLVVTAEESAQQVAARAVRLGIADDGVLVVAEDDVDAALAAAVAERPDVLVVDSIQTVRCPDLEGVPGGVTQVRESADRLIRHARSADIATFLVGHVTKEGSLAGPKLLEHMVDVVLSLEGDADRGLRALRAFKNRFGSTDGVALFDMAGDGLVEVEDPSAAFLSEWQSQVPGTVVFPALEGRRAILVEIQALVTPTAQPQPRRSVRGIEAARIHQVLAVLQRHCGLRLADKEVYVNVVGGWRLAEPAADLAVALAVASSCLDVPLGNMAAWGEIGLAGEVRAVPFDDRRRAETQRQGVEKIMATPPRSKTLLAALLLEGGLVP